MKVNNKDVIQSYILTASRYDFDVYEKRILYRLVELCQKQINGQKLDKNFTINKDLWDNREIRLPISFLLNNEVDHNHVRVKSALRQLNDKKIEYEDDKVWKIIRIIEMPNINKFDEFVEFKIQPEIYETILNFSKGYRKFELATAMKFKSVYAMRFYELFSGNKSPIIYKIDHLKIMFKVENQYKRVNDFFRFVIEPAKKELDEKSPYSFKYEPQKEGKKITKIKFYPVFNPENRDPEVERQNLQKQLSPKTFLDNIIVDYLKQNYGFDSTEIHNNIELFQVAEQKLDLLLFLSKMKTKCESKSKPKGYLINAIKRELNK